MLLLGGGGVQRGRGERRQREREREERGEERGEKKGVDLDEVGSEVGGGGWLICGFVVCCFSGKDVFSFLLSLPSFSSLKIPE